MLFFFFFSFSTFLARCSTHITLQRVDQFRESLNLDAIALRVIRQKRFIENQISGGDGGSWGRDLPPAFTAGFQGVIVAADDGELAVINLSAV